MVADCTETSGKTGESTGLPDDYPRMGMAAFIPRPAVSDLRPMPPAAFLRSIWFWFSSSYGMVFNRSPSPV